jgi:autophagy-related protein 11
MLTLLAQVEIFLFDRVLFSTSTTKDSVPADPLPEAYVPESFPDTLQDSSALRAWQTLFKARRDWAFKLYGQCRSLSFAAESYIDQTAIIEQAARIAVANLESRVKNLEQKFADARKWLEDITTDTKPDFEALDNNIGRLDSIPAKVGFGKFFKEEDNASSTISAKSTSGETTLAAFVDRQTIKKAASTSKAILEKVTGQLNTINVKAGSAFEQYEDLVKATDPNYSRSIDPEEPKKLLQEVEAIAKKVSLHCDEVLNFKDSSKVPQASKIALLHTRNFLPGIQDVLKEASELLRHCVDQKNVAVERTISHLQTVATIEATIAGVNKEITGLHIPDDGQAALDQMSQVNNMPFNYGSLLIEAVRRHEWIDKMKRDSSSLAEELAVFQDEEQKRRKKWLRGMSSTFRETIDDKPLGFEINLQGKDDTWPQASRHDIDEYIKILQRLQGMQPITDVLTEMVGELDRPTRQQVKRAKNFKQGSVHEAGFGKGSLLLRGEDEARVLREANSKLEEELKGHKSRIRKLEDLLHRQSVNRLSIVNGSSPSTVQFGDPTTPTQEYDRQVHSPRPEELSRRSSVSSRRFSSNLPQEDKTFARRIVQLEAELAAEKEARTTLAKEALALKEADEEIHRQIQDANSTKKDLMENMEAQQREFADERHVLEEELSRYKIKVDEVEDELERILGSRDDERTGTEGKIQALTTEIEQVRKDAASDVQKAEARGRVYEETLRRREELDLERQMTLKNIFSTMSPEYPIPEDSVRLVTELEVLAQRSVEHAKELAEAVAMAKSENDSLQSMLHGQKDELVLLGAKLEENEAEALKTNEELDSEKAKAASLTAQLEEEQQHLQELRTKFAEGETGSEALRRRVTEEEAKVTLLSTQLAKTKSHVNSLDVELSSLQSKYHVLSSNYDAATQRLQQRSQRAKDITQRLYAQNNRLNRLLESLGFAVSHQDGQMVIQRASKAGTTSAILGSSDTVGAASRHVSLPDPSSTILDNLTDLSPLLWMEKDSPAEEAHKFAEFLDKQSRFNLDTFCDALAKRMKDVEHTARKWQKEARAYRDKAQRLGGEAHDKIAYRGFKEGDLALFLPTRNQVKGAWAAFNVGAPHYFLREEERHRLKGREWLVARITKVQERVVDLSRTIGGDAEAGSLVEDDNPFDLSDGLRWYLLDAQEEKPGAPSTPGLGKTTVAAANVDVRGSLARPVKKKANDLNRVEETLSKSLDSRRSSSNSKKSGQQATGLGIGGGNEGARPGSRASSALHRQSLEQQPEEQNEASGIQQQDEEVRRDLLWGP